MHTLVIKNLTVEAGGEKRIQDATLDVKPGEIHALVGPNGSGKSSLAFATAGHPDYRVLSGSIRLGGIDLLSLPPEERARKGLFLSFQEPPEIGGVSLHTFLKTIGASNEFPQDIFAKIGIDEAFPRRFLNEGFSGGEKKKSELLQLVSRRPRVAILDEIDTGLDSSARIAVPAILHELAAGGLGILVITHSFPFLNALAPSGVSVCVNGRIIASGGKELISQLETKGYEGVNRDTRT